ncbi:hypothetical protein V8G54_021354 [Vigna mungo]|uniref:Uncharacterized protein n=1 Tax=Vigna mungo TaxID=3915 RepID=A0AAQ3NFZ1_VIGMU
MSAWFWVFPCVYVSKIVSVYVCVKEDNLVPANPDILYGMTNQQFYSTRNMDATKDDRLGKGEARVCKRIGFLLDCGYYMAKREENRRGLSNAFWALSPIVNAERAGQKVCGNLAEISNTLSSKSFVRKNSDPFTNSLSRTSWINNKHLTVLSSDVESDKMSGSHSLGSLVLAILLDKKPEEVPMLVESVLCKVVEEFEQRIASQGEKAKVILIDPVSQSNGSVVAVKKGEKKIHVVSKKEDGIHKSQVNAFISRKEDHIHKNLVADEESQRQFLKQKVLFDQQQRELQAGNQHTLHTTKSGKQIMQMQMKFRQEFNLGMHIHGLTHAASGYDRVLEENHKLYNQVQDLKGNKDHYFLVAFGPRLDAFLI